MVFLVIRTLGRVAPDWDLSGALPTELQRHGDLYLFLHWKSYAMPVPFIRPVENSDNPPPPKIILIGNRSILFSSENVFDPVTVLF